MPGPDDYTPEDTEPLSDATLRVYEKWRGGQVPLPEDVAAMARDLLLSRLRIGDLETELEAVRAKADQVIAHQDRQMKSTLHDLASRLGMDPRLPYYTTDDICAHVGARAAKRIARLEAELAAERTAAELALEVQRLNLGGMLEAMVVALGMDAPLTLLDAGDILRDATEHLLDDHDCDDHGHEGKRAAVQAWTDHKFRLRAALVDVLKETTGG